MTDKRATPETDAALIECGIEHVPNSASCWKIFIEPDFARSLERQRDELREVNAELVRALNDLYEETKWRDVHIRTLEQARAALSRARDAKGANAPKGDKVTP